MPRISRKSDSIDEIWLLERMFLWEIWVVHMFVGHRVFCTTLLKQVTHGAIQFTAYEELRKMVINYRTENSGENNTAQYRLHLHLIRSFVKWLSIIGLKTVEKITLLSTGFICI